MNLLLESRMCQEVVLLKARYMTLLDHRSPCQELQLGLTEKNTADSSHKQLRAGEKMKGKEIKSLS